MNTETPILETLTLKDVVAAFNRLELPGQPQAMHMATAYLVNQLWAEVERLRSVLRPQVQTFAEAMELKLRKNDHKTDWRTKPIEAFVKLLMLEVEEFKVADEFFTVEEARKELVDISNFALILHDRLGMIDQDKNRHEQK